MYKQIIDGIREHKYFWKTVDMPLREGIFVRFQKPEYKRKRGSRRKYEIIAYRQVAGRITNDSYGDYTGQHTFTIREMNKDEKRHMIKGRHLYPTAEVLCAADGKILVIERSKAERELKPRFEIMVLCGDKEMA